MPLALALLCLTLLGCGSFRPASSIITAQAPGVAQGAGATVIGPTNAQTQTIQVADRKITYITPDLMSLRANIPVAAASPSTTQSPPPSQPLASIEEHVSTTIGSHQDAAVLIKVATGIGSWGKARWVGILFIIFGALAIAWSHNNPDGYPLVAWKFLGAGLFLALFDPSPWWLCILIIPAAFYAYQKLPKFP
jgi:type IV secretory pathway VirB2 component (pilin)